MRIILTLIYLFFPAKLLAIDLTFAAMRMQSSVVSCQNVSTVLLTANPQRRGVIMHALSGGLVDVIWINGSNTAAGIGTALTTDGGAALPRRIEISGYSGPLFCINNVNPANQMFVSEFLR